MRRRFKNLAQNVLALTTPFIWRARRAPGLLILTYHRVLPTKHPDRKTEQPGMYVSPETLEMHIRILKKHLALMHLDDWLDAARGARALPAHACALTFDDGWRDNYTHGLAVLKATQAPATIYLVSDLVGGRYVFWPTQLARLVSRPIGDALWVKVAPWLQDLISTIVPRSKMRLEGVDATTADRIIGACKDARTDKEMLAALFLVPQEGTREAADAGSLMTWSEAREMAETGWVRFGSHSRHHTRLSAEMPPTELQDEIQGSWQMIKQNLACAPRTFAFPNGNYFPGAIELVRGVYRGAVTTHRGWNTARTDAYQLRRVGMHDGAASTPAAFLARLARFG